MLTTTTTSSGMPEDAAPMLSVAVTVLFDELDVWVTPPTPASVQRFNTCMLDPADKAVVVVTPPWLPSLMRKPLKDLVPVRVKGVLVLMGKVVVPSATRLTPPRETVKPPLARVPVMALLDK